MKKKRTINNYVEILTYIWLKWIKNHQNCNNVNLSYKERRKAGQRCELIQKIRQTIITKINKEFDLLLKNAK